MDALILLKALLLGLVEGLTEFLPISSTGHLIIVGDLLDFNDDKGKAFEIFIQFGAILAVCWEYRAKLAKVVGGLGTEPAAQRFALNLAIGVVPAVVLGLLLHKTIKTHLFSPLTVAGALIVGGLAILWIERLNHRNHIESVDDMRWWNALLVGCAQSVAMFPGVSRSGATIMGGLLLGLSRRTAAEFSFFLAIPTMFMAASYDLYKNWHLLHASDLGMFALGFIAAFFSALLAVRALLHYISRHSFDAFAWYRIGFGLIVLFYFW